MSSSYFNKLNDDLKKKYTEKLYFNNLQLPDPLDEDIRKYTFKSIQYPFISIFDIFSYLVVKHQMYSKNAFNEFTSLPCYNYVVSGKVKNVKCYRSDAGVCIVTADVESSQTLKKMHFPWIISTHDGEIMSAHCTCMAGLGETCTHVGATLFFIEKTQRKEREKPSCTSEPCTRNITSTNNLSIDLNQVQNTTLAESTKNSETSEPVKKKSKGHRCYFCGQRFLVKTVLRKHISIHKDRDFFCDVCGKSFVNGWGLRKHMRIHTGDRPFACNLCDKTFVNAWGLRKHMMIHTGDRPFACNLCDKAFAQKYTLQVHLKSMHTHKQHPKCQTCGKRLKSFSYAQCWLCRYEGKLVITNTEVQISNKDNGQTTKDQSKVSSNDVNCNSEPNATQPRNGCCEIIYSTDQDVTLANNKVIIYLCEICNVQFNTVAELKHHQIDNGHETVYGCEQCGQRFSNSVEMNNHLATHSSNMRLFPCPTCHKEFKKDYILKSHMVTHTEERPYICKICQSTFKTMPTLRQHLISHSNDRPFICKECGSGFKSPKGLKSHFLTHNKDKPLACKTCGKTFTFLGSLQRHIRVHTGVKPFQCKQCNKCFSQSNGLKAHELIHAKPLKEEEYFCNVCGRKFKSLSNFKKHLFLHG